MSDWVGSGSVRLAASQPSAVSPRLAAFIAESPLERRAIHAFLRSAAATMPTGTRVLDAGAGEAPYRELFAHCDYRTTDWSSSVHPGAAQADIVASLDDLPVADGSFEIALLTQVLEHVVDPIAVLAELRRVLVPGGRLLLTVPFVGELHEEPWDFYRYTNHALSELLLRAGFAVVRVEPAGGYYTALGQVMRNCGLATGIGTRSPLGLRLVAASFRGVGGALPALDRLDRRRALPLAWHCEAVKPSG
jgi:SAM-dependent methyltransferase